MLPNRPMILPSRHFVYPAVAEEVERGALEVLIQPAAAEQPFLATCALGFRDPAAPTGLWAMPNPDWLCAVSGGYAYLIDTTEPARFVMIRYRPVLDVVCCTADKQQRAADAVQRAAENVETAADDLQSPSPMLLFAGHHSILAWGRDGEVWESDRLSAEGITGLRIEKGILHGLGWDLRTDKDLPFTLDLETGKRL
jgi:hypothetical protein